MRDLLAWAASLVAAVPEDLRGWLVALALLLLAWGLHRLERSMR